MLLVVRDPDGNKSLCSPALCEINRAKRIPHPRPLRLLGYPDYAKIYLNIMAGSYPDIPSPRIAYDRDGTLVYTQSGDTNAPTLLSQANTNALNDEANNFIFNLTGPANSVSFVFPQNYTITHVYLSSSRTPWSIAQKSPDTTNLVDGTWTQIAASIVADGSTTGYRNSIIAIASPPTDVKALRLHAPSASGFSTSIYTVQLYGYPTAASDRLEFWHPTLDQSLNLTPAYMDWGDVPRSSSNSRDVRIKNISSGLTANTITVGVEALQDGTPAVVGMHTFSYLGGAYGATASIPSLAPGAISGLVTVKLDLTATAPVSIWSQRLYANAGSWS